MGGNMKTPKTAAILAIIGSIAVYFFGCKANTTPTYNVPDQFIGDPCLDFQDRSFSSSGGNGDIVINEFFARSDVDHYDWMELYNTGRKDIDVGGMYITNQLTKWWKSRLPLDHPEMTTIPSKKYLVIIFDQSVSSNALHVDFDLEKCGDEIAIYDSLGVLLDQVIFGEQEEEVTFGRYPDGASKWRVMPASPNGRNQEK